MSSEYIFRAEYISKQFAGHTALNNVSISVPRGKIFGILGPNGAGKTTLIRIINQILAPDEGKLYFNDEPLSPRHISSIGYLPEERGLYKKMKVGEQVLYLARLKGLSLTEAKEKTKKWFLRFEMQHWWNKKIEELSKGMQQKVQFISTVLHEPELLIFDEPFSGFDPVNAEQIKQEIIRLRTEGATIIFSTHRMESVEELCDHIALIHKSQKILDGSVHNIRRAYRTQQYEARISGNTDLIKTALTPKATLLHEHAEQDEIILTLQAQDGVSPNEIIQSLLQHAEIHYFSEKIPSMHDIFIQKVTQGKE